MSWWRDLNDLINFGDSSVFILSLVTLYLSLTAYLSEIQQLILKTFGLREKAPNYVCK
jgi:hypothetical protein